VNFLNKLFHAISKPIDDTLEDKAPEILSEDFHITQEEVGDFVLDTDLLFLHKTHRWRELHRNSP
jgi:hypothetical protein